MNKVAIITGAARGIGAATAAKLAKDGCDIAIIDLDSSGAHSMAEEIKKSGQRVWVGVGDVSDYKTANHLVESAHQALGRMDILVNNAGITRDAMTHKMTESQWDDVIRVNLKGPFNMAQACAAKMIPQLWGRIINISSVSRMGNIGQDNYSASKAGVVGLTQTLALELARHGILVNAIAPGFVDTPMTQAMPPEIKAKIEHRVPLKRLGRPEEIAAMIAFLASEQASYITGQIIEVDGGLTCGV